MPVDSFHSYSITVRHCAAGFVVVSALANDSQYVSPASTKAPSPMGSRGGSFTGTPRPGPAMSGPSDQSAQSTGRPADTGDTASSGTHWPLAPL